MALRLWSFAFVKLLPLGTKALSHTHSEEDNNNSEEEVDTDEISSDEEDYEDEVNSHEDDNDKIKEVVLILPVLTSSIIIEASCEWLRLGVGEVLPLTAPLGPLTNTSGKGQGGKNIVG